MRWGICLDYLGILKKRALILPINRDSRPVRDNGDFKMGFFIDCQGHYEDEPLQRLFAKRGEEIKWLGSYIFADIR